MASARIKVSADSAARSVGADAVAAAFEKLAAAGGHTLEISRPGSPGLYWLEPLVQIDSADGPVAFGPMTVADVDGLLDPSGQPNRHHPKWLGLLNNIPQMRVQDRLTFARVGRIEPLDIAAYRDHDGLAGLRQALAMTPDQIIELVTDSGLRGRGGAAFPTGIKWRTVAAAPSEQKYVVCNADEGDSGTFADRMIMESDPFVLIEGMVVAGLATGATEGFIYLRAEYPQAIETLNRAIVMAEAEGLLGDDILGSGRRFGLQVRKAAGAYICGEETAMLESLEGKRGMIRYRPPLPAVRGLFQKPTVVNNVITLAAVPLIAQKGAQYYRDYGSGESRGTLTIQLAGNIAHGGLYELPFGISLREVLYDLGGGSASGRPIKAVQAGGPLGAYLPESQFDTPLDYEAFQAIDAMLGHGGLVVFDDRADLAALARFAMEFCAIESCGKCTPCRIGAVRGTEVIDRIVSGQETDANRALLDDLCATMSQASLCGLGGMAPNPVMSIRRHFPGVL